MIDPDLQVETIVFGPDAVDITWTRGSEQTEHGDEGHAVSLPPAKYEAEVMELVEAVHALVDAYELAKRNPPSTVPGRRR